MAEDSGRKAILLDPGTLSEEYIPKNILQREEQIAVLKSCFSPILKNDKPLNVWLHGKPGTGKTATAKHLVREICTKSGASYIHVNCRKYNSFYSILNFILNEMRAGFGNERDGRVKLEKIEKYVKDKPMLIILDEIDFLPHKERNSLLYSLSFGKVGLVCISEDRDAVLLLNGRAKSRLQPQLVEFKAYSPEEIKDILKERAVLALDSRVWSTKSLDKIAGLSKGDARAAIQTLRGAAEFSELQGSPALNETHINKAFCNVNGLMKSYTLKRLGNHYEMIYGLIERSGPILSTDLWNSYLEDCKTRSVKPAAKRTYSYHVHKMTRLKLIDAKRARIRGHVYEFSVRNG